MSSVIRHDLMCADPEVAYRFYAELFGWQGLDVKIKGFEMKRLTLGERVVGAIVPFDQGASWIPYMQVADVSACCHRVTELGGDICIDPVSGPPGRYAVVNDPTEAVFSPFEPRTVPAWAADAPPDNAFAWDQLITTDVDAARAFYVELLGWTAHQVEGRSVLASDELPVASIAVDQLRTAGARRVDREAPAWLPFIKVDEVDRVVRAALALGGSLETEVDDDAVLGPIAVLRDPTGAVVGVGESLVVRIPASQPEKRKRASSIPITMPRASRLANIRAVATRRR